MSDPVKTATTLEVYRTGGVWKTVEYKEGIRAGRTVAILEEGLPWWKGNKRWYVRAGNEWGKSGYSTKLFTREVIISNKSRNSSGMDKVSW